jgi:antibiotic biosynthesis monooxygenase (ABM) superfamily enzyme
MVVGILMPDQPALLRLALSSALVVATLTWIVMPNLTRALRRWL